MWHRRREKAWRPPRPRLWTHDLVRRLQITQTLEENGHSGCVNTVRFSDSGRLVFSGSDDTLVCIWDVFSGRTTPLERLESGHYGNIFLAENVPCTDESQLVTCAADGQVRVLHVETGDSRQVAQHRGRSHRAVFDPHCPHALYSCGGDGVAFVDLRVGDCEPVLPAVRWSLNGIVAHPYSPGPVIGVCGDHCDALAFDMRMPDAPAHIYSHPTLEDVHATALTYDQTGRRLMVTWNDDDVLLYSEQGTEVIQRYAGHRNYRTVKEVQFWGPHDEYVLSGSDCGALFVWETESAQLLTVQPGDAYILNAIAVHPQRWPVICTSGIENTVKVWEPSLEQPWTMDVDAEERIRDNTETRAELREYQRNLAQQHFTLGNILEMNPEMLQRVLGILQLPHQDDSSDDLTHPMGDRSDASDMDASDASDVDAWEDEREDREDDAEGGQDVQVVQVMDVDQVMDVVQVMDVDQVMDVEDDGDASDQSV